MTAEHGFPTTPPAEGAVIPQGSPALSAEARALNDNLNQQFAEMSKAHKADLEAFGVNIHDKLDPRLQAIDANYKTAAEAIKDLDLQYQKMQADLESRSAGPVDDSEAVADRLWTDGFEAWVRSHTGIAMTPEQSRFMIASNQWITAEAQRKPENAPVAFDPVNAVSAGGLQTDFGPGAGVWARPTFERKVDAKLKEYTQIRQFARVIPIGSTRYVGVIRNANAETIERTQEGVTPTQQTQKDRYEERPITPYEYSARPAISRVALEDSIIPLESEIRNDAAVDFAVDEAAKFINGTGSNEPQGYAVDANVTQVTSRTSSAMDHYDLTNLAMNLRPIYRNSSSAAYALSTDALTTAMLEEDGFGRRLWQPANTEGVPSILNGWRYFEATEQASIATAAEPVFFANWDLFYRIVDRRGMLIIRDEVTVPGIIILNMSRRFGGRTWLVEAGRALTIA